LLDRREQTEDCKQNGSQTVPSMYSVGTKVSAMDKGPLLVHNMPVHSGFDTAAKLYRLAALATGRESKQLPQQVVT